MTGRTCSSDWHVGILTHGLRRVKMAYRRLTWLTVCLGLTVFMGAIPAVHAIPSECDAIAGNLVTNCGFETPVSISDSIPGWLISGNINSTNTTMGSFAAHSGDSGVASGPVDTPG